MDLQKGMTVKFTDKDDSGKFSHVGKITNLTEKTITFDIGSAVLTIPVEEANKLQPSSDKEYRKAIEELEDGTERALEQADRKALRKTYGSPKQPAAGSKRECVEQIVRENPKLSRKELIALAVEKCGMTPAGASTYVSEARKLL